MTLSIASESSIASASAQATPDCAPDLPHGRYRHYKGQDYEVLGLARHSETEEWLVVYRCLYGDYGLWVRPYMMFTEQIMVDGHLQARFAYQNQPVGPAE